MTIEDLQQICRSLPAVTEDIKWENHLCFNVGGKMFLVTAPDEVPVSASFKVNDEGFEVLPNRKGFIEAPYMARYKWIRVDDITLLSRKEWEKYLRIAYDEVVAKLPAKFRQQISGNSDGPAKPAKKGGGKATKKVAVKKAAKKSKRN